MVLWTGKQWWSFQGNRCTGFLSVGPALQKTAHISALYLIFDFSPEKSSSLVRSDRPERLPVVVHSGDLRPRRHRRSH